MQTAVNTTNIGPQIDQYLPAEGFAETDLGNVNFASAGNYVLMFTVTGKSPASTAYSLTFDYFTLTPQ